MAHNQCVGRRHMMAAADTQNDLVLPNGRQVLILNDKGVIETWVGPTRVVSSSSNERPVVWNPKEKRFDVSDTDPKQAIRPLVQVNNGEYVILEGIPVLKSGDVEYPPQGTNTKGPEIDVSQRTILHGPKYFALWPRQVATVISGHHLAYDEFVLVRVYDEGRAKANVDTTLVKEGGELKLDNLTMGAQFVIKGTEVSFYMPGPGIEVLKDEAGFYVRRAVTLEQLEYAYLRDRSGKKEYVIGPDVVFPKPTQTFVTRTLDDGTIVQKFRVIELTETSALYVKVTAPYEDADGTKHKAGDELFLTGKEHPLYWPRIEHMLIRQGTGSEIHQSIAIPDPGNGYYVRNKKTWTDTEGVVHKDGVVELILGPKTLLIDPRHQTLAKRALPPHLVELMYPGNQEALLVNAARLAENAPQGTKSEHGYEAMTMAVADATAAAANVRSHMRSAARGFEGDVANRPVSYAKPHYIDLGSSKYEGAPRMALQPGYAVLLINSVGMRRVVKDGEVALPEYDEAPAVLRLSTGTPKKGTPRKKVVYLRTATKISDSIQLETSDGVLLQLQLSYRVRFEGDPTKWFDVEDPVGFLTDNLRSRVHHDVSKVGIREFYADFTAMLRTFILGVSVDGTRAGFTFTENGLRIYDVDVIKLSFVDHSLEVLFEEAAKDAFRGELQVAKEKRGLALAQALTEISLAKAQLAAKGADQLAEFTKQKADADAVGAIAIILAQATRDEESAKAKLLELEADGREEAVELANERQREQQTHALQVARNDEELRLLEANVKASIDRLGAIQPGLIEALTRLGNVELIETVAKHFNVQAMLGGTSVVDAFSKAFAGTPLMAMLEKGTGTNGRLKPVALGLEQPRG